MQVPNMNFVPPRYTKNQAVFGKFAASLAGLPNNLNNAFNAHSPLVGDAENSLLTPESFQMGTVAPQDMLTANESPLFDEIIDNNEMQEWESLFLEDPTETSEPAQMVQQPEAVQAQTVPQFQSPPLENVFLPDLPELYNIPEDFGSLTEKEVISPSLNTTVGGRVDKPKSSPVVNKKVDDLGITVYKRKPRSTPLKPVEVSENSGEVAVKRAKNTEAARRSRARKLERMSQLETRVRELLEENERLKAEINLLKHT